MTYQFTTEYQITKEISHQINLLLKHSFGNDFYKGRDYFKQIPHHRLLLWEEEELVAHLGVDHRVMSLDGNPVYTFGIIDFCVHESCRGKGLGKNILEYIEKIARESSHKVDFLFLVTDTPAYYAKLGYSAVQHEIIWLKIDQHQSLGLGKEKIDDVSFMIKVISGKPWEAEQLDMLGYMF